MLKRLLTPDEVAQMCQVPKKTLAEWRSTGRVDLVYTRIGRAIRYLEDDVISFIQAQRQCRTTKPKDNGEG